jgi:hypothetical protein
VRRWASSRECDEVYADGVGGDKPETEAFALGGGKTLVLIPCGSGAYNYSTVPFVVEGGKAAVARFDRVPGSSEVGLATLVNAGWDAAKAELGTYAKGRGIGDCGASETFVWDGAMFRLIELRAMGECRGSTNFLRLWKAEAGAGPLGCAAQRLRLAQHQCEPVLRVGPFGDRRPAAARSSWRAPLGPYLWLFSVWIVSPAHREGRPST